MPAGEEKPRQETKTETPAAGGAEKEKAPAESKVSAPAADETPKAAEAGKPAAGKAPTDKTEKCNTYGTMPACHNRRAFFCQLD